MKINLLKSSEALTEDTIKIERISATTEKMVAEFLINYDVKNKDIDIKECFIVSTSINDVQHLVGLFICEPNDIRNCLQQCVPPDVEPILYHEISHLYLAEGLFTEGFLVRAFSTIIPCLINYDVSKKEVIWFYLQEVRSQVIEDIMKHTKGVKYYFENESMYFATHLIQLWKSKKQREDRINLLKDTAKNML